jgi:hypothetical protein
VALRNPHVQDVGYQHPAGYDRGAVRLVVYLFRRPDDKKNATRGSVWATVPEGRRLGDAGAFIRAANARTRGLREDARGRGKDLSKNKARWCTSFVNVVLSPANRERLSDGDFARLAAPWVRDADGRELPHVGAIHREGNGKAHLHLGIVRDKFSKDELKGLKQETDALATGLELERDELAIDREELSDGLEF